MSWQAVAAVAILCCPAQAVTEEALIYSEPAAIRGEDWVRFDTDECGTLRINGAIAWATFEIPPRYRAGIEFFGGDSAAIEAYALRHQA